MNIDPAEKEKFNKIADEWWDPNGKFAPLHVINPLRSDYISEKLDVTGIKAIDVACGGGLLAESLHLKGAEMTGVDISDVAIHTATIHAEKQGLEIKYLNCEAEDLLPAEKESYDLVTCLEAIEHVPDPAKLVETCSNLCKPGGTIVFSTINRNPKSFLFAIIGAEYVLRWLPIGTHEWEKFVKPEDLIKIQKKNNLKLEKIDGMKFNLLSDKWSLSSDKSVNYISKFIKN